MIHFSPSFYLRQLLLSRQIPKPLFRTSYHSYLSFFFHPTIFLSLNNMQINPTSSLNFRKRSSVISNSSLLHIQPTTSLSDIHIKDSRSNDSTNIIEEILKSGGSSLQEFKNFEKSVVLKNQMFCSRNPLDSVEFFLMDVLYSEKELIFEDILLFIQHNTLSLPPNSRSQQLLSDYGLTSPFSDAQIKKLYLQYCIKVKTNHLTINLIGQYSILRGVIEIVLVNYICSKLSEERGKDFGEMYEMDGIVGEVLWEVIRDVFGADWESRKEEEIMKIGKKKIVVMNQEDGEMYKVRVE